MKKLLLSLLVLLPIVVNASETEIETTTTTTTTNEVTTSNITKSPDTGVEDYFLTLGIVSVALAGTIYFVNKKDLFNEI